ncbi:MAG: thiamine phosphate synthase [Planctomycetes bacterium]|nr:thiamine phosphate synthase [Planctomycetota bacterium]
MTTPSPGSPVDAAARLTAANLCVVVDGRDDEIAFARLVADLFGAGVGCVQIRDKRLPTAALLRRVTVAVSLAARGGARAPLVIVNDRADIATAGAADGVHVGADDLPVASARALVGPRRLVGRTAHDPDEVAAAWRDGADYVGVGPCYPSATKAFATHASPAFLAAAVRSSPRPVFAIGGITLDRLDALAALGITRVAVAAAITAAPDPARAAAAFLKRLARPAPSPVPARREPGEAGCGGA